MKDSMETRLVQVFNKAEQSILDNFEGKRSNFGLKQDIIDLKYDVVKLILEATHRDKDPFNFDIFADRQKKTSPFLRTWTPEVEVDEVAQS